LTPLDTARHRSTPLDTARHRSTPLDTARQRSTGENRSDESESPLER
jgi:hypothetical protein